MTNGTGFPVTMRAASLFAALLIGCSGPSGSDGAVPLDLASATDLSIPPDLATPGAPDLAAPSDAAAPDLAVLPDLAFAGDLSAVADLAPAADLASPPDLTFVPDLSQLPDLTPLPDLTSPPDLTPPLDLTMPPDLATPIQRPFDWVGVIGTGQSLSVGAVGNPPLSTKQPYSNLKLVDPNYNGSLAGGPGPGASAGPLVELIRTFNNKFPAGPNYPNNIYGETPHSAMANQLSALSLATEMRDYTTAHSAVGESGQSITVIRKNGTGNSYAAALYEARAFTALAKQAGKSYGVGAILLTHGETDWARNSYEADIHQLWADYNADLPAITGQQTKIPLLVSQQGTFPNLPGSAPSTLAEWKLGLDYPGDILCVGPKYQYEYANDHVHLTANGYRRLGEKYAEVYFHAVMLGKSWKPIQPNAARVNGNLVTLTFDVPVPPLQWDPRMPSPHQQANKQWRLGRGFEATDQGGPLTISAVDITGPDTVQITLDKAPGAGLVIGYAMTQDVNGYTGGTADARAGQLRDSDDLVGYDTDTIPCSVVAGSQLVSAVGPATFARRSVLDVASSPKLPADTVIRVKNNDTTITLSAPFGGPTGNADLVFHNDLHNYSVQFSLHVQ